MWYFLECCSILCGLFVPFISFIKVENPCHSEVPNEGAHPARGFLFHFAFLEPSSNIYLCLLKCKMLVKCVMLSHLSNR